MEARSTSFSDGSTTVPDYYGLRLRRAIDQKVRKLRTLLTADKDITTELDRVVCRLMKISLCTSKGRQNPPPISWMQCKLFDLLTLTEKAIERRIQQRYSLKAIQYHKDIISLAEIKIDPADGRIVSKYQDIQLPSDLDINDDLQMNYDSEFEDYNISITSNEFKECEHNMHEESLNDDPTMIDLKEINDIHSLEFEESGRLGNSNLELVPYSSCRSRTELISSGESTSNGAGKKHFKQEDNSEISLDKKYNITGLGAIATQHTTFPKKRSKDAFEKKHNIHKTSRTKINKKVSSRRSSYFLKNDSFEYKKYKLKGRKRSKEHQLLQSTPSRPIPASLIELCHSQSNKNLENFNSIISDGNMNLTGDIAATEECMFIGIVTEDGEEYIAMRRNIGISPEFDLDCLENEDLLETVINLSDDNSFYCKPVIKTENVQSQTIFLYDLNEPSTSKGVVRHLSTDVQCGPDVKVALPMFSETTSFTRLPKLFTMGIKIEEPSTDRKTNKNTYDYGTCTGICDSTLREGRKSVGIKIKESIQDVAEFFMIKQGIDHKTDSTSPGFSNYDPLTETKLLKSVSSTLKIEDSGSEFCGSVGSYAKSPSRLATSSKNTSDFQIQSVSNEKNEVKLSQTHFERANLVCGGIHVHSFKERHVSDVVYQGKWQRKHHLHKINRTSIVRKSISLPKRQKVCFKEHAKTDEINRFSKKAASATNPKLTAKKPEPFNKPAQTKKKLSSNPIKTSKIINNDKKIVSKIAVSSNMSKNTKTIYTTKKRTSPSTGEPPIKKEKEYQKNKGLKNYLPLYLQRKIRCSVIKKNNNDNKNKVNTDNENIRVSKTRQFSKDLIKIPEKPLPTNINYIIFRNEIQTENDSDIQLPPASGIIKNENLDCSHSPQSQHSSTCSSPNSIATVRAISTRNRITSNWRNSTSSERSSPGVLEAENKTTKNKKFSRRGKNNKKQPILCDNKENVPESSKNTISPNKDSEKTSKSVFLGRTKSVFMAQLTTETSPLPLTSTTISKPKVQSLTKSLKLGNINTRSNDDQTYEQPTSSILEALDNDSKKKDNNESSSTDVPDDKEFIYESFIELPLNNSCVSDTCRFSNDADEESLNSHQSIYNTKSGIISAIRILIETKLNLPENTYDHNNDFDSETVILSRDDHYVDRCQNDFLPASIGTHKVPCESESDIDCSHINFSSAVNENDTVQNTVDFRSPDTDFDALSLKSFASMSTSKFSEYYLADNELESTLPQVDHLNISSIQDLFERKELNTVPNVGGLLAIQAFSGFSVNEPISGDQPDFVNFIDSETGSFAFESARQATSEEIFVSGRSSDTYESCYVDDDAYVPNWLFNMISQQQSAEESEVEDMNLALPMPIVAPDFDMNGNLMEPEVGVGAGAGDGRGMHSDHSQDSSGRGTSLSSSETSSGPQSEAILINPSTFAAHVDHIQEPMAMIGPSNRPDRSRVSDTGQNNGEDTSNRQSRVPRILITPNQIGSDIDADVSSLETDAVDSDT